jgi:hypothetical protein
VIYEVCYDPASQGKDLAELLLQRKDVTDIMSETEIRRLTDPANYLGSHKLWSIDSLQCQTHREHAPSLRTSRLADNPVPDTISDAVLLIRVLRGQGHVHWRPAFSRDAIPRTKGINQKSRSTLSTGQGHFRRPR